MVLKKSKPKVCLLTTSLLVVKFFLLPHIIALSSEYDLTVVVNVDDEEFLKRLNLPVRVVHLPIKRKISPFRDLKVLVTLAFFLARERFDVIHTVAPKAGMVGIIAGWLARVPVRLHIFQGEVWATHTGVMRTVLRTVDKVVALLSTHLLVVSQSERDFLIREKIISAKKSVVLGKGSISGVDMSRFKPDAERKAVMRKRLSLTNEDTVLLYLGRLTKDKGILDLYEAFGSIDSPKFRNVHLVIVGPDEEGVLNHLSNVSDDIKNRIHILPYTDVPEDFLCMADILVLPSYREGFGVVVIEAAAFKVPSIGSRIYGITDAIQENQTGVLFEVGNKDELVEKIKLLAENSDLRKSMGNAAFKRCQESFEQQKLIQSYMHFYKKMLSDKKIIA